MFQLWLNCFWFEKSKPICNLSQRIVNKIMLWKGLINQRKSFFLRQITLKILCKQREENILLGDWFWMGGHFRRQLREELFLGPWGPVSKTTQNWGQCTSFENPSWALEAQIAMLSIWNPEQWKRHLKQGETKTFKIVTVVEVLTKYLFDKNQK